MTVIFCIILTSVSILISGGALLYFNKFKNKNTNDINVQLNSFTDNFQKNISDETQKLSDKIYKDIDSIVTHINSIYKTIETITNGITKISEKIQSINNFNETTISKVNELTTELSTQRINIESFILENNKNIDDIKHNNIDKESIINDVNQKINTYTTFVNNLIGTSLSSNNEVSKLYNTLQDDIMTLKTNNTDLEKSLNTIKNYISNNDIKLQSIVEKLKSSISEINDKLYTLSSKIEKQEETNTQALIDTITPSKSNMEIIKPKQKQKAEDNIDINNIIINKVDKKQKKAKKDNISEETNNTENNVQLTNINTKPHNEDSNILNKKIKGNSRIIIK